MNAARRTNAAIRFARRYGPPGAAPPFGDRELDSMADALALLADEVKRLRGVLAMPASAAVIPIALEDEDGERWWLEGHVPPPMAALAVVVEQMVNVDADAAMQVLVGGPIVNESEVSPGYPVHTYDDQRQAADELVRNIEHFWAKPRTDDGEYWDRCSPDDDGAMPWTEVRL